MIYHAISCPKDGLVLARHGGAAKDWGALGDQALITSAIAYEPKINIRMVQGEKTKARARQHGGTSDGGADTVEESQGGRGQTMNGAARLLGRLGQVQVPAELRSDVIAYSFWKWGTTAMFDTLIVNLNTGSYLRMNPGKAIAKAEKEKKDLYLQACLERKSTFTPMVYSADIIHGVEALAVKKRLAALISYKLKREYP